MTDTARRPVKRRRGEYKYADDSGGYSGVPPGDLTIMPGADIELVRPQWESLDTLIFRPLPCLTDTDDIADAKYMPYRDSPEKDQFGDWIRNYPAVKSFGFGKDRYSFLMYDRHAAREDPNFERSQLPYILIHDWATKLFKDRAAPSVKWNDLTDGRDKILTLPTSLFFIQAII